MKWFGESWGAPVCQPELHVKTPVGSKCFVYRSREYVLSWFFIINDSEAIPESEREVRIKEAFKRIFDIEVEFVDGENNDSISVSNGS